MDNKLMKRMFLRSSGVLAWQVCFFFGAALLLAPTLHAQDLIPKAPPQSAPVLLQNATIHTVSDGVLKESDLLFDAGMIVAVGQNLKAPAGARRIDARGKHVYPGFICVASSMGLIEVDAVDMTLDVREAGTFTPEVRAAIAVNPDSWHIPVARRNGVLTCGVMPQGGSLPGRLSVIRMDGWTSETLAIETEAGLVVNWPFLGASRRRGRRGGGGGNPNRGQEQIAAIDAMFEAAAAYHAARQADPSVKTDLRLEAMGPALRGEKPVFVNAATRAQIESAVRWGAERGLRLKIVGGRDADQCIDFLKARDIPVALTATHRLPQRRDLSYRVTYELPKLLEDSDVSWCLTFRASEAANTRNLPYEAAACVPFGLSREKAVESITLAAAKFLGVDDRLGSLEKGKWATLIVADGDPFEFTTELEHAFIDGREIALVDKQTQLAGKYREKYRQLGLLPRADAEAATAKAKAPENGAESSTGSAAGTAGEASTDSQGRN